MTLYRCPVFLLLVIGLAAGSCNKVTEIRKIPDPDYYGRAKFVIQDNAGLSLFDYYLTQFGNGLRDTIASPGPYTVMAPDNTALSILLGFTFHSDTILAFHQLQAGYCIIRGAQYLKGLPLVLNQELTAINGKKLWVSKWVQGQDTVIAVNGAKLTNADAVTTNGLINVLYRPYLGNRGSVIETINGNYQLSFFAAALQRTHLDTQLQAGGPYTLLAPDNTAFRNAGFASIDSLLKVNPDTLKNILQYHILPGRKFIFDMQMDRTVSDTLHYSMSNGGMIRAIIVKDNIYLDPAAKRIVFVGVHNKYDPYYRYGYQTISYPADNGAVHVIDKLLLP